MYIIETHPASLWLWLCLSSSFSSVTKTGVGKICVIPCLLRFTFLVSFFFMFNQYNFLTLHFFFFLFRTDSGAEILQSFFQIFCEIILQCECVYLCARGKGVYVSRVQPSIKSWIINLTILLLSRNLCHGNKACLVGYVIFFVCVRIIT